MNLLGNAKQMFEGGLNTGTSVRDKGYQLVNFLQSDEAAKYTKGNKVLDKLRIGLANLLSKLLSIADMILDVIIFILELIGALENLIKEGMAAILAFIFDLISAGLLTGTLGLRSGMRALYDKICKDTLKNNVFNNADILSITIVAVTGTLVSLICNGNMNALDALEDLFGDDIDKVEIHKSVDKALNTATNPDPVKTLTEIKDHRLANKALGRTGLSSRSVITFLENEAITRYTTLDPKKRADEVVSIIEATTRANIWSNKEDIIQEIKASKKIKELFVRAMKSKIPTLDDPENEPYQDTRNLLFVILT